MPTCESPGNSIAQQLSRARNDIERLRDAMDDALEMLADTSLNSEDRAGNAQMCLALALRPALAPTGETNGNL